MGIFNFGGMKKLVKESGAGGYIEDLTKPKGFYEATDKIRNKLFEKDIIDGEDNSSYGKLKEEINFENATDKQYLELINQQHEDLESFANIKNLPEDDQVRKEITKIENFLKTHKVEKIPAI